MPVASVDEVIRRQTVLPPDRFELADRTATMAAVVTPGLGGFDSLEYREVPIPRPAAGEALLQVLAAGVNATDINARLGWYSPNVADSTTRAAQDAQTATPAAGGGGWRGATPFPLIQGTDCCGRVVEVGPGGDRRLVRRRVLVRPCMRPLGFASLETIWMGSDFDGSFAQYVSVPASEIFAVDCTWSDVDLGSITCAFGTAESMLHRAQVVKGDHVLVTGASGGVGSALVQLAKRRGATVTAVTGEEKTRAMLAIGADQVLGRGEALLGALGEGAVDVVADNVSGPDIDGLLAALRRGGRYVSSGAIGGPIVTFDKRALYLRDLTLIGCTAWDEPVFAHIISSIERNEICPVVAATFPLERIADAQYEFLDTRRVGKIVLVPPRSTG